MIQTNSSTLKTFLSSVYECQKKAETLYREMSGGKEVSITVKISPKIKSAAMNSETKTLFLHPDFALPKNVAEKMFPNNRSRIWNLLREDKAMFSRGQKLILAHEVAHLYLNHRKGNWHNYTATFLMLPSSILLIPYLSPIPFFLSLFAIRSIAKIPLLLMRNMSERHHEFQADLKALEITQDLEGLEYFLEKAKPTHYWFLFSHPSPEERIRYLREHYKPTRKNPIQSLFNRIYKLSRAN